MGPSRALALFSLIAALGYGVYLAAPNWRVFLVGTVLAMAWESMSQPAVFSLIGEALGRGKRAMGFSVQYILKRIPRVVAPPLEASS
ncbi:MAG: hypothetical protein DRK00_02845 [Thermoprotei archaeon]|nr:MAG: hypothetical protein DRK00_02845 [Thermoprotei archaeon]